MGEDSTLAEPVKPTWFTAISTNVITHWQRKISCQDLHELELEFFSLLLTNLVPSAMDDTWRVLALW